MGKVRCGVIDGEPNTSRHKWRKTSSGRISASGGLIACIPRPVVADSRFPEVVRHAGPGGLPEGRCLDELASIDYPTTA